MLRHVTSLREQFGKRVRQLRAEKGFNQLYLATLMSVGEDFISQLERGICAPSFETLESLASALETDVKELFTFPGDDGERQQKGKNSRLKPAPARQPKVERRRKSKDR
jgi:transcriptional regulator with XRE-family HTH domain